MPSMAVTVRVNPFRPPIDSNDRALFTSARPAAVGPDRFLPLLFWYATSTAGLAVVWLFPCGENREPSFLLAPFTINLSDPGFALWYADAVLKKSAATLVDAN